MKTQFISNNQFELVSILLLTLFSLILSGCNGVVSEKTPPYSHIHIGHTLTGWGTTPGKKGLLTTAEQEASIVVDNASKAASSSTLSEKKKYIADALHAVDPKIQPTGAGKGFGLTRALTESMGHLQYAANSADASKNIKTSVHQIKLKAQKMAGSSNQLKIFGQAAKGASTIDEMNALVGEFLSTAKQIKNGEGSTNSYNLVQFRSDIQAMVAKEKPAYTTVSSYYLFNLIRLPSGKWGFSSKPKDATQDEY